jgi:RNA recognition motif-containing protein
MDEADLKAYFGNFGQVTYFKLGRSKKTQEPLGFAFVEYADEAVARSVLSLKHFLDQREIDVKPFGLDKDIEQQQEKTLRKKIYVKGIPEGCLQSTLLKVFSEFGSVERAFILQNHKSNTSRGFGFVEFTHEETVSKLVGKTILIDNKEVYISRALERTKGKKGALKNSQNQDATDCSIIKEVTKKESLSNKSQTDTLSTPEITPGVQTKNSNSPAFKFDNFSEIVKESNTALFSKFNPGLLSVLSPASRNQLHIIPENRPALHSMAIGTPFPLHSFEHNQQESNPSLLLKDSEVILGFYANLRAKSTMAGLTSHNSTSVRFNVDRLQSSAY